MMLRESQWVELVDSDGEASGVCTVAEAHTAPGRLHRAFSVLLVSDDGRMLLQQRSAEKTRFALRWANTCCGHPFPGQPVTEAATIRLGEELGLPDVLVREAGVYRYRAEDPRTGLVEDEYDHVVVARIPASVSLRPDPAEVGDVRWVSLVEITAELSSAPAVYSPWLAGVVDTAIAAADRIPEIASLTGTRPRPR